MLIFTLCQMLQAILAIGPNILLYLINKMKKSAISIGLASYCFGFYTSHDRYFYGPWLISVQAGSVGGTNISKSLMKWSLVRGQGIHKAMLYIWVGLAYFTWCVSAAVLLGLISDLHCYATIYWPKGLCTIRSCIKIHLILGLVCYMVGSDRQRVVKVWSGIV